MGGMGFGRVFSDFLITLFMKLRLPGNLGLVKGTPPTVIFGASSS
jgi:hypothetical protein